MRHISLDESFWRSAPDALSSSDLLEGVEPSLLDVALLVQRLHDLGAARPAARLGFLTLGDAPEERALSLLLAAFAARAGRRVLLVDLDFGEGTWARLLGGNGLEGVVEHVSYGTSPRKLVRPTSWDNLRLLPAGTAPLNVSAVLRSHKLRACLASLAGDYDLLCLGLPFEASLELGEGAAYDMKAAVLVGAADDELGFELAIPRLLPRTELLATVDVMPLGRCHGVLAAALPALLGRGREQKEPAPSEAAVAEEYATAAEEDATAAEEDATAGGEDADFADSIVMRARAQQAREADTFAAEEADVGSAHVASAAAEGASDADDPPPALPPTFVDPMEDRETALDVAFLSGLVGNAPPPPVHPKLRPMQARLELESVSSRAPNGQRPPEDLAAAWEDDPTWDDGQDGEELVTTAPSRPAHADEGRGWFGRTVVGLVLCLLLGAGGFWYWRSNQQIPEGEFAFVETSGAREATVQAGARGGMSRGDAAAPGGEATPASDEAGDASKDSRGEAPSDAAGGEAAATAGDDGATTAADGEEDESEPGSAGDEAARAGAEVEGDREPAAEETAAEEGGAADADAPSEAGDAATDAPAFTPPNEGPLLGYSLHVGSFQTYEAARRAARALRAQGHVTYVAPVLLEEKGEWYRVFLGAQEVGADSEALLRRVRDDGSVAEGTVRTTPWALYLGTFPSREGAVALLSKLDRSGISAYAAGEGPVHVYAGAFESAADAELLNRQLRERGFDAALVRRRAGGAP